MLISELAYFFQGGYSAEYLHSIPLPKLIDIRQHSEKISQKIQTEMNRK